MAVGLRHGPPWGMQLSLRRPAATATHWRRSAGVPLLALPAAVRPYPGPGENVNVNVNVNVDNLGNPCPSMSCIQVTHADFVKAKDKALYKKKGNVPEGLYL